MRHGMISSCITGISTALLLAACSAAADDPSSVPQEGPLASASVVTAATAATIAPHVAPPEGPGAIACFDTACSSNAECVSLCHEAASKCVDRHCYVP